MCEENSAHGQWPSTSSFQNTSTRKKPCTFNRDCKFSGKTNVTTREQEVPQTELEKLDSTRSKLEQSVDAFIKARKELEEIFSAEGSSEQGRFLTGSSADLKTELKRHRELTFRVESSLKENKDPKHHSQGTVKLGSSYEFLKSIMD
ncbi:uncharacterized protein itgb3bp isoform X2 [Dicentrarchus labrax]|uniref:uncharacterized protein itgb3bp isoform X2 n=1 Tax=Dicentrarchus labrax TaxID=13489 RepID=UPI0021F60C48|nr:uncharacterized protein itgb3bp isoform X2 [Dicentrarchus labrax]